MALQFNIAGIGSRFVALLLDMILLFVAAILLVIVLSVIGAFSSEMDRLNAASKWLIAVLIFIPFLIFWGYFTLFEAFWRGQTLGKRMMKLRVIKDSGRQITFFEALARNLLRYVDYLPGFFLVGVITMACNKLNKRVGDFVAGTIVVHEQVEDQPMLAQAGAVLIPRTQDVTFQPDPWMQSVPSMFPADAVA